MKDKLRELAERWSAKDPVCEAGVITITMNQCAAELLAIPDVEGDGGVVPCEMCKKLQGQIDALHTVLGVRERRNDQQAKLVTHSPDAADSGRVDDVSFSTVEKVVKALCRIGHTFPESQEEQAARFESLVLDLCRSVQSHFDGLTALAAKVRVDAFAPIPEAKDAPTDELWNAYNVFNDHYCGFNTQQALRYAINNVLAHRAALAAQGQGDAVAEVCSMFELRWAGGDAISSIVGRNGIKVGDKLYTKPAPPASPAGVPDGERSDVWVVQDENGQPIHCASWPLACHEHINDAINEHGIDEARAWKVLHYSISETTQRAEGE